MTDWDIAVRGVAQGKEVNNVKAADCLSSSVVTVTPDDSGDDCYKVTVDNQVRRGATVDDQGGCCGLV